MKYSNDKKVAFDNESHSYFYKKRKLISVTTFIDKFKNKFDEDFFSEKIALKRGVDKNTILLEWREKSNRSCEIGSAIHKIFEDYTEGKYSFVNGQIGFDYLPLNPEYCLEFEAKKEKAIQFIKDFFISGRLTPVHSELIVYNDFLAGQIDMICICRNGLYHIIDFKTNSKIETYSYGKYMLSIFSNYPDSNFYHYSLQLSVYKKMCKFDISSISLIHITSEEYKIIECEDVFNTIDFNEFLNC